MKNQVILLFALFAGICAPLMGMETNAASSGSQEFGPQTANTRSRLVTQILKAISGETVQEVYAHQLGDSLMRSNPKKFITLLRKRIFDQLDREFEMKGVTPEHIAIYREEAQERSANFIAINEDRFKPASSPFYKAAHRVTHLMPGPRMKIVDLESGDVASTCGRYLFFDELEAKALEITPRKALALAGHERRHYLNNDLVERDARRLALEDRASKTPLSFDDISLLELFHRAQEAFADLETSCENLETAQAVLRMTERGLEVYGEGRALTHPSQRDRFGQAQLMVQFHQETPQELPEPAHEPFKRNVRRRLAAEMARAQEEDHASDEEKSIAQKLLLLKKST